MMENILQYLLFPLLICLLAGAESTLPHVEYACFNTIFEVACSVGQKIVFESARYGRNDTAVAAKCQVPYQRNCDIDVHFPLNRACAGKRRCNLAVNTALFNDPCGYEEFLRVTYRCAPAASVHQTCQGPSAPPLYDHGYLASPNYPGQYYMDASCSWVISVQRRQTIKITIFDFELDVKRGGRCHDVVEISTIDKVYFSDCGSMGKEVIAVEDHLATVTFNTRHTSLTQRGFFMYFEGVGPGCPDLEEPRLGSVSYFITDDVLYANASCDFGYFFVGTEVNFMQAKCLGSLWSDSLPDCIAIPPATSPRVYVMHTTPTTTAPPSILDHSGSLIGIALGVVSAILLITLLLVLALYFHRSCWEKCRRRKAERKLDQWRVVINNLQADSSVNEENMKRTQASNSSYYATTSSPAFHKKINKNYENPNENDPWPAQKLLGEDEDLMDYAGYGDYPAKYPNYADNCPTCQSRRNSLSRAGTVRYTMTRSRDSALESPSYGYGDTYGPPVPPRACRRPRRTRSGQWDSPTKAAALSQAYGTLNVDKKNLSRSAPDLISSLPPLVGYPSMAGEVHYQPVPPPQTYLEVYKENTTPQRCATIGPTMKTFKSPDITKPKAKW